MNYIISLNQLADFSEASRASKQRIIKQQINPSKVRVSWYQMSKARIKKSIELKGDLKPIQDGIQTLADKKVLNKRQQTDKIVSIEALQRFITIKLPAILSQIDYTLIKPEKKTLKVEDVDIVVAPELVIKGTLNGQTVLGAVKIHISKNKPFGLKKSSYVASTIFQYLKTEVAKEGEVVLPELCICLDVFSLRLICAPEEQNGTFESVKEICIEVKDFWNQIGAE